MEINITELNTSHAKKILDTFRHSAISKSNPELKIADVIIPEVLIIQATDITIPNSLNTLPGIKIATHDDVIELAEIDYGVIKIL